MFCCFTVKSCWCMRLHTAAVVIGWLNAVWASFKTIVFLALLVDIREVFGEVYFKLGFGLYMGLSVGLLFSVLDCIASGLVIAGARKNAHLYLLPWLVNSGIDMALKLIVYIAFLASIQERPNSSDWVHLLFVGLLFFGIFGWMWVAVFSLFKLIREEKETSSNFGITASPPGYTLFHNPGSTPIK